MTTKTKTAHSLEGHEAVEDLVAAIDSRLAGVPEGLHLDDLMAIARDAIGYEVPGLEAAAQAVINNYRSVARAQGYTEPVAQMARVQLSGLLRVADEVFVNFDQASELDAAEAELAQLEQDYQDAMVALETAVESADVDEVMRLRSSFEIVLPQQRGAALVRVLELRIARAEQGSTRSTDRQQAAGKRLLGAEKAQAKAAEALQRASAELQAAQIASRVGDGAVTEMAMATKELVQERDRAASDAARSSYERVRRLAGLTSTEAVSA